MNAQDPGLYYVKTGHGDKTLLLFHGFGQDHSVFLPLVEQISHRYTCYIFDLYFHGKSHGMETDAPLEKNEWKTALQFILDENGVDNFSLLGYSLGAKFVLSSLESFPAKVKEIFLIAPDGIHINPWYKLATSTLLFRKLFKSMIYHHDRFMSIAKFANTVGLVDNGLLRFAENQMSTEEKRRRVYYSWVVLRNLKSDLKVIADLINKNSIELTIVVGKLDKVIPAVHMHRLLKHVPLHRFEIADATHRQLIRPEMSSLIIR